MPSKQRAGGSLEKHGEVGEGTWCQGDRSSQRGGMRRATRLRFGKDLELQNEELKGAARGRWQEFGACH